MNKNKQYLLDFISITIGKNISGVEEPNKTIVLSNIFKILEEIILIGEYRLINKIIKYFEIDEIVIGTNILHLPTTYDYFKPKLFWWMYNNNINLLRIYFNYLFVPTNTKFIPVPNIIMTNYNILKTFYSIIVEKQNEFNIHKIEFSRSIHKIVYVSINSQMDCKLCGEIRHLILITNICILDKSLDKNELYFDIFDSMLTNKFENLRIIKQYCVIYGLTPTDIKNYFDKKKELFVYQIINSKSYDKVDWFFNTISDYTKFITPTNCNEIFACASHTKNVKLAKYIYEIILICGYEIKKDKIYDILCQLMCSSYQCEFDDKIVYELINLGIKPPHGISKYTDYYKSIKILN